MSKEGKKRKVYQEAFKLKLVNECRNSSIYKVAKRHGVGQATLHAWVKKYEALSDQGIATSPPPEEPEVVNVEELLPQTMEEQMEKLQETLIQRAIYLAATTKRLTDVVQAMQYLDNRGGGGNKQGDLVSLMQSLESKTKALNKDGE